MRVRWQRFSDNVNGLTLRERGILVLSVLAAIYVAFDLLVFSSFSATKQKLSVKLDAAKQKITVLEAEKLVFITALSVDPHVKARREIKRLQAHRKDINTQLRELSVGLVSAQELPQALRDLLPPLPQLQLLGLYSKAPVRISFGNEASESLAEDVNKQLDAAVTEVRKNAQATKPEGGENVVDAQALVNQLVSQNEVRDSARNPESLDPLESGAPASLELSPGVYKHSVVLSVSGGYFAVLDYFKSLEAMPWQFYWQGMDYVVDEYPHANVTLEVFTLSAVIGKKEETP